MEAKLYLWCANSWHIEDKSVKSISVLINHPNLYDIVAHINRNI